MRTDPDCRESGVGAPEEIEITPAMIEAGLNAWRLFGSVDDSPLDLILAIWEEWNDQGWGCPVSITVAFFADF